jgi:N-acetylglucosamine kinase-like BadF-type ATPase
VIGLGIDCGGSATRWTLRDEAGPLSRGEAPAANGHLFAPAGRAAFEAMAAALGRVAPRPEAVVAGVTGLGAGTAEAEAARTILAASLSLPAERVHIGDDMWIAYRALFRPGDGHVVSAGSGSIGYHLTAAGVALRTGGRGMAIDDGGSAFWIGREALSLLLRRADADPEAGRRGLLAEAVHGATGGASWPAIRAFVYADPRARLAALAMPVAAAAHGGDADALGLMRRAGEELARLATALIARAGARPVALVGRAALLHPALPDAFRACLPDVAVQVTQPDAAGAAARLALGDEAPPVLDGAGSATRE